MKKFIILPVVFTTLTAAAQERGNAGYEPAAANQIYGDYGNYNYSNYNYNYNYNAQRHTPGNNTIYQPNDSVYAFHASVCINLQPDSYVAVFNVQQEGLTVSECHKKITERIDKFTAGIKSAGIKSDDIFIDLIAQTRIYDYKIVGKTATETSEGFEVKKNVIISFTDHSLLQKMLTLASEQEIYDIVKVDYIINDMTKVQEDLRKAAMEIIDSKRKFVLANSSLVLNDKGLIQYENVNTIYPGQSYHQYVAAEGARVQPSYYSSDRWIKEQRKSKTFYFEKLNPAQFDKVINPNMVQIPVQMTLDISVKYYIGKAEKKTRK